MSPNYTLAKDIEQAIPSQYNGKVKSFSTSSSIKGDKIHCYFDFNINNKPCSSHISFEIRDHASVPYDQYIDIIVQNILKTYDDFANKLIAQPGLTNLSSLENKYSKILDEFIDIDLG